MTLTEGAAAPLAEIRRHQWERIRTLMAEVLPSNRFQASKLRAACAGAGLASLEEFSERVPLTTKPELAEDQAAQPPYGTNLTYPVESYSRFHQTSGTTGQPLRWLDTMSSWNWVVDGWKRVYECAGVGTGDRILVPFSFGPFLGFWAAFDAAVREGWLTIPGGGMRSQGRLRTMLDNGITVFCATPTYAVRLAEVAAGEGIDLRQSRVRLIILAGEPGGSIPAMRAQIEGLWPGGRVVDHHGMTETGPVTYECPRQRGIMHVMEAAYFAEILDTATLRPVQAGGEGELVLTTLGREGSPLLRYRTGDLVRTSGASPCACGSHELALEGGILARIDEMFVVRGVNLYPSAVEAVLRAQGGFSEFRVEIDTSNSLAELRVEVEPAPGCADATALVLGIETALSNAFSLRVPVECVGEGTLPRYEMKSRRWHRR